MSRYRCVDAQKAAGFPIGAACAAAGVSTSAYYAWAARRAHGPSDAGRHQAGLIAGIRAIHTGSDGVYGSPRVTAELRRRGWRVNRKRVARLMAGHGLTGYRPRRRRGLTKPDAGTPPAPDLLGRRSGGGSIPPSPTWPGAGTSPGSRPARAGCTWPA